MQNRIYNNKISNGGKLTQELIDAGLTFNDRFFGTCYDTGLKRTTVYVADNFSQGEATTCDGVVASHVVQTVSEAKASKRDAIDQKTQEIIFRGAPYDNRLFSMTIPDQSTWHALYNAVTAGQMVYPFNVVDLDSVPYAIASAQAFYAMYFTGFAYVAAILDGGRQLKNQVNACTDIACVNSIVDPRE